jgi:hypothetical protein
LRQLLIDFHASTICLRKVKIRIFRRIIAGLLSSLVPIAGSDVFAVDFSFNINYIAEANPFPPNGAHFSYADVWAENGYAYVGSDRGIDNSDAPNARQGVSVFSISPTGIPIFLDPPDPPPSGFIATTYFGSEMEDVEVYDGIGYFSSDISTPSGERTGVDIVNLSVPFDPFMISRVDTSDCLSTNPSICAHGKVHTLSIQRINPGTPSEQRFMYTADNTTDVIKITNVTNPSNPQLIYSLDIGAPSGVASHEVVVRNNRLYVASKSTSTSTNGWFHIFDVTNPAAPSLPWKAFLSGARTHTAMPTYDGNTLVVAEERLNGNLKIYDISMINQPNDPDTPILRATLNRANVCHNGNCLDAHTPHHVHVHGNLIFVPWYEGGLQVFNISNPASPVHVGAFDTFVGGPPDGTEECGGGTLSGSNNCSGNWGVDLSLGLNRVLISDRIRGLIVVDASGVVLRGDFNQDMFVNGVDYAQWRAAFGSTGSGVHDAPYADGNLNGVVDSADYVLWRNNLGQSGPFGGAGAFAVPEPASFLLVAAGIGAIMAHRRGRRVSRV